MWLAHSNIIFEKMLRWIDVVCRTVFEFNKNELALKIMYINLSEVKHTSINIGMIKGTGQCF